MLFCHTFEFYLFQAVSRTQQMRQANIIKIKVWKKIVFAHIIEFTLSIFVPSSLEFVSINFQLRVFLILLTSYILRVIKWTGLLFVNTVSNNSQFQSMVSLTSHACNCRYRQHCNLPDHIFPTTNKHSLFHLSYLCTLYTRFIHTHVHCCCYFYNFLYLQFISCFVCLFW